MSRGAHDWHGIHGSAALRTGRLAAAAAVARAESLAPGEMRRVPVDGELLGAARVRGRFAALPLDAFDRAGALLAPEEQGAYFQLLRLSFGEGRNFCRVPKKDLMARIGATERRLNRILDALVRKRLLRLLHRDNRGTLLRVFLPREAAGEPLGDDVLLGRAAGAANEAAAAAHPELGAVLSLPKDGAESRDAPPPTPLHRGSRRTAGATSDAGAAARLRARSARLAAALAVARGESGADAIAAAADEIEELLADGATPRQVEAAVAALARRRAAAEGDPP